MDCGVPSIIIQNKEKPKLILKILSNKIKYSYVVTYNQVDNIESVQLDIPFVEHQELVVVAVHFAVQNVELTQQLITKNSQIS
jgi:hypothetical protein